MAVGIEPTFCPYSVSRNTVREWESNPCHTSYIYIPLAVNQIFIWFN
jgi:hypothetical protein